TAANDSGVWNEKGAEVILKVEGPIWESTWFRTLVGLGLIGLISLAFLMRIARDKRRKREQDRFTRDMLLQQEADRKRIARELHDSLEQNLLVIKNRATLTLNSPEKQEKMGTALKEISHISLDSIQEVRSIANNLRPYQIDRLGLDKAIQGMLNQIADASAISIEHEIEPIPKDLSSELQINLYRIIQEGMNNSLKHAEATQMIVTLLVSDRAVTLRIKDNGCGFDADAEKTRESHGFGLSGIRERSTMFNGTSELITAPGNGTEWIIRFPIG
ncbi:sensor histidine kinase, partial [Verrucomicrobia bacterium]|nr:sensor histidine kinase [Verrucomicrobiota bacterium]